jgi:hypothetical protein
VDPYRGPVKKDSPNVDQEVFDFIADRLTCWFIRRATGMPVGAFAKIVASG